MILDRDKKWAYSRQLTNFEDNIEDLTFAIEQFVIDLNVHCVVRMDKDGKYAVFAMPILTGYTEEEKRLEMYKLSQERMRLEVERGVQVVDLFST